MAWVSHTRSCYINRNATFRDHPQNAVKLDWARIGLYGLKEKS